MSKNTDAVAAYFRSVDAEDLVTLGSLFDADAVVMAAGAGERRGERILNFYKNVFKKFPEHRDAPTRILEIGQTVVAEIEFTGRSSSGVEVAFPAVDIFDLQDGKIVRLTQWVDTSALERKLAT
jgi:ketosteroid isomerase-like protein